MTNPTNDITKFPNGFNYKLPYINSHDKRVWLTFHERGWLGSGLTDCNGVEIFEGDIVHISKELDDEESFTDVVLFKDGVFTLKDFCYSLFGGAGIEVVGHVATEEADNDNRT